MLPPSELRELVRIEAELKRRRATRRLFSYTPYPKQLEFHAAGATDRERLLMAGNQLGKELRYDEPVLTPRGWKPIGEIRAGDEVIAGDGSVTIVTGVYPQGVKPLVEMEFSDGQKIAAGYDHLWVVQTPRTRFRTKSISEPRIAGAKRKTHQGPNPNFGQWKVMTTREMRESYGDVPTPRNRFATPHPGACELSAEPGEIDPYVVGLLLGDGGLSNTIVMSTGDAQIAAAFTAEIERFGGRVRRSESRPFDYIAVDSRDFRLELEGLGMMGTRAHEKSVPEEYLWADVPTRLALLQGLMDTDGTCEKSGITTFTSVSRQLAQDVVFLVRSLGGRCRVTSRHTTYTYKGEKKVGREAFTVVVRLPHFPCFRLERKQSRYIRPTSTTDHNLVVAYRDIGSAEAVCISVAHPSRTYITRDFIVTHNTWSMGFELAMHLTGRYPGPGEVFYPDTPQMRAHGLAGLDVYPNGWPGHRFNRPIWAWAGSVSGEATRDNPQRLLIGPPSIREQWGTGAIPLADLLIGGRMEFALKNAPSDALDHVLVNNVFGGTSILQFKTYEQGREKWQGPTLDFVWFDEEPPLDIYMEGLTRTNTTQGPVALTFTPLLGMSEVVRLFLSSDEELTEEVAS